ncbi:FIG00792384: hypothetical protein [hydrothermal vent metagenome]|uniref:Uncharacterized protein n=1 Tax=hydrothermal vent metagenome TaxID=652676 RepID=A0A3B0TRG1_9ZZZZ
MHNTIQRFPVFPTASTAASPAGNTRPQDAEHDAVLTNGKPARGPQALCRRARLLATTSLTGLALAAGLLGSSPTLALEDGIIFAGSMAVTGFAGTYIPKIDEGLAPGLDPIDETFIDIEGPSLRIFDVRNLGAPASGQLVATPEPFEVEARKIGQVFGLAYDDGIRDEVPSGTPNLYASATSLLGIRIVTPDEDADGRPERRPKGAPGANFMEGQFGDDLGGGPGAIYKIDGLTGEVTLFANIDTNAGAGIGNIAFDKSHRQFYASDLDNGDIYRIDMDGNVLDSFDHGVDGRPKRGLAPVADDGAIMDIGGGAFDTEDPETWGYTQDERRVWGLAYRGGRLYYAVGDSSEIWSVRIRRDGTFADDPHWELDVKTNRDYPVTDIAFDTRGFMYLAQRGEIENRYDYSRFANTGKGEVVRYWRESPDDPATESIWVPVPQEYAVGFPDTHRQSAGGIDLQYGYDRNGYINRDACSGTLAKTGDNLRNNPLYAKQLAAGGPYEVHGVQLTPKYLVKPQNEPPFGSWFFDYDDLYEDADVEGHVGDVEIWSPCQGQLGYGEDYLPPDIPPTIPPGTTPEDLPLCVTVTDLQYFCTPGGLEADLYLDDTAGIGGDSVKANSLNPGVSVSPLMQTRPDAATPFTFEIFGNAPGETVNVGLCFYKKSDADAGGYFPCCKVTVPLDTPEALCP